MLQALRIPDFRLLWGGGLVSSLGSWLLVLALPAHILAATGSLRDVYYYKSQLQGHTQRQYHPGE